MIKCKKFLPYICTSNIEPFNETSGRKLRDLRLKKNLTIKQLSENIGINPTTLMHVEQDKISVPYHYFKLICDYFKVNHASYLQLYTMNEDSMQDKLIKIRALLGARTWKDVAQLLGYRESFINDLMTRYKGNEDHTRIVNNALEKLKQPL